MIQIKSVSKTFKTKSGEFSAVKNVTLTIHPNTIHGIIGPSGAGKSTLIRLINQLEVHDHGEISIFNYEDIKKINKESTRMFRRKISMIFQRFNLLERKTVFQNIALPITFQRKLTDEDNKKIYNLISLVGLSGYEKSYPSQLSGGQLQRVGIARALINDPDILLCDEPTSALDTLTIKSVLALIKKIKEELNLTVIIVTHDMNVIKEICDNVTVMNHGIIVENDSIDNIIFSPESEITKSLLDTVGFNIDDLIHRFSEKENLYLLRFVKTTNQDSVISSISRDHLVNINILYANITPKDQGIMLVDIEEPDNSKLIEIIAAFEQKGVLVRHV